MRTAAMCSSPLPPKLQLTTSTFAGFQRQIAISRENLAAQQHTADLTRGDRRRLRQPP